MAERELYQIYQLYFNSKHTQLINLDLDLELGSLDPEYLTLAKSYQIRSLLALSKYDEAAKRATDETLSTYINFLKSGSKQTEEFDSYFGSTEGTSLYQALYFAKIGEYETALSKLNNQVIDDISLGVYISLKLGKLKDANAWIRKFPSGLKDTFIYNLSTSWVELMQFGDSLDSSYYQYDEVTSNESTNSIKSLICLFVANLKLLRFPEAKHVLDKINTTYEENPQTDELEDWKADLIINQISYKLLTEDDEANFKVETLLTNLKKLNPEHEYLQDLKEKNDLFDTIVEKYKA